MRRIQVTPTLILDEKVAIVLSAIAIVFLVIGIYAGWWELTTVLEYIPEIIFAGIIGVLIWGFRKRIENTFEKTSLKRANLTDNQQTDVKSRGRKPSESDLDDLIREIEDFITKWRERAGFYAGYRRSIETRLMLPQREKVKEHSKEYVGKLII